MSKYQSIDQTLNAVSLSGLQGSQSSAIQNEFKGALRPMVAALFESEIEPDERDQVLTALVDKTIPEIVRTVTKHWAAKAA